MGGEKRRRTTPKGDLEARSWLSCPRSSRWTHGNKAGAWQHNRTGLRGSEARQRNRNATSVSENGKAFGRGNGCESDQYVEERRPKCGFELGSENGGGRGGWRVLDSFCRTEAGTKDGTERKRRANCDTRPRAERSKPSRRDSSNEQRQTVVGMAKGGAVLQRAADPRAWYGDERGEREWRRYGLRRGRKGVKKGKPTEGWYAGAAFSILGRTESCRGGRSRGVRNDATEGTVRLGIGTRYCGVPDRPKVLRLSYMRY